MTTTLLPQPVLPQPYIPDATWLVLLDTDEVRLVMVSAEKIIVSGTEKIGIGLDPKEGAHDIKDKLRVLATNLNQRCELAQELHLALNGTRVQILESHWRQ